jgi:DNA-binding HxlR family transcriptional regulator
VTFIVKKHLISHMLEDDTLTRKQEAFQIVEDIAQKQGTPIRTEQVAERTDMSDSQLGNKLSDLVREGRISRLRKGVYDFPERVEDQDKPKEQQEKSTENGPETLPLLNTEGHASESGAAWEIEVESYMSVDRDILRAQSGGNPDQMAIMTVPGNQM